MSSKNPLTRGRKQQALALLQQNRPTEALELLQRVCDADPRDAEAWCLAGAVHGMLGKFEEARASCQRAIAVRPDYAEAHYNLGLSLRQLQRPEEAISSYERAIELQPSLVDAYCNLGIVLDEQGRQEQAIAQYRRALDIDPHHADTHYNLGVALRKAHCLDEAIASYQHALRLRPDMALAWYNLGNTLADLRRYDRAVVSYRRALEHAPNLVDAHFNLANTLRDQNHMEEAIDEYRRAIHLRPDCATYHFNLATIYLILGRFAAAWPEYDWRWRREHSEPRPFLPSPWDGSDLKGQSVFLHAEQGLGDELFFLRFVPALKLRGAGRVVYRPNPKLGGILSRAATLDAVLPPDAVPTANDMVFSVGDLPRLLDMERVNQIPPPLPLTPMPATLAAMRERLAAFGPPPYIGVTWRAGTPLRNALYKEVVSTRLAELFRTVPGTILILQRQPASGEIDAFGQALGRPAHDLSALNDDLEQMLALLFLLDDYVGVSNTNMHLRAGAGKTAKVLVPAPPEWRWMAEGKESPWFPGFRVHRQGYDGSWEEALEQLVGDLTQCGHSGNRQTNIHDGGTTSTSITGNARNTSLRENKPMKLNLGCGDKILPGYVNIDVVDTRHANKPDVVCDLHKLDPFEDNSVDEILAVHVVEHFWRWEVVALLEEWVRVLKPGGKLILECPNLISACQEFLRNPELAAGPGREGQRTMWVWYGDPSWQDPYMTHRWAYTPHSLGQVMAEAGLVNIQQEPAQFKLREPRDMRVTAIKSAS